MYSITPSLLRAQTSKIRSWFQIKWIRFIYNNLKFKVSAFNNFIWSQCWQAFKNFKQRWNGNDSCPKLQAWILAKQEAPLMIIIT